MALNAQAAPLMNLFELGVAQGKTAKYDQVAEHNIGTSIANEKGTLAMYSVKQQANPEMAYMVEIYADGAAYQIHRNSPQYQAFVKVSPEILTAHKKRMALVPQFLGDKKVKQTAATQARLVSVTVKPEHNAAFSKVVRAEMAQSLQAEHGVLACMPPPDKTCRTNGYFLKSTPTKPPIRRTAKRRISKIICNRPPIWLLTSNSPPFRRPIWAIKVNYILSVN